VRRSLYRQWVAKSPQQFWDVGLTNRKRIHLAVAVIDSATQLASLFAGSMVPSPNEDAAGYAGREVQLTSIVMRASGYESFGTPSTLMVRYRV
jgi:hypothetical protein